MSKFSQKRTCKNCVFSELNGCHFGVKVEKGILSANTPLEPCHKVTTEREESAFHRAGMDNVFRADLALFRAQ